MLFFLCTFSFASQKQSESMLQEKTKSENLFITESTSSKTGEGQALEEELTINVEKLDQELKIIEKNYRIYKGLAITGYSLAGFGLALIIVDALAATPSEDPTDTKKFRELTWSAIPFLMVGTIFSITFRILETTENDKKLLKESSYYNMRGELELIQSQLYGETKKEAANKKEDFN